MAEIRCPHCGEVFQVDESEYAQIVRQVRDSEFEREIASRVELARVTAEKDLEHALAEKDKRLAEKDRELLAAAAARDRAVAEAAAERERALAKAAAEGERAIAESRSRIAELEARVRAREESFATEKALAVSEATSKQGQRIVELEGQVNAARLERDQVEASLRQQLVEQAAYKDQTIRDREDEIERLRSQRARLSTKLIGETLEQHCETEFNRWRATAFRNAEFHKDNDVVDGTKGDYVFREVDDGGVEVVSIMFEMKNEDDSSAASSRKKNADFFRKLDQDRRNKGCEYAVLVSMLEPESELYNAGIVDVSYAYEKMYVIRPQFFIPMITLLRNAAENAHDYRRELADVRQQNIDITHFEDALEDFKTKFGKNCVAAKTKFDAAIKDIDKAIKDLQRVRDELTSSENQLRLANKKAEELTIRKLTWKNPTMREKFEEARAARKEAGNADEAIEPDAVE